MGVKRLGRWWRLWIATAAIWVLFVCARMVMSTGPLGYASVRAESVRFACSTLEAYSESEIEANAKLAGQAPNITDAAAPSGAMPGISPDDEDDPVEALTGRGDVYAASKRCVAAKRADYSELTERSRWAFGIVFAGVGLLPPLILLVLGALFGRIRRAIVNGRGAVRE